MAENTFIIGSDPGDDYSTITAAVNVLTADASYSTTNQAILRVKGPNSGGPATYTDVDGLSFQNPGGWVTLIKIEAFDPSDPPIIDGTSSGQLGINILQTYLADAPDSWTNKIENVIFQNWSLGTAAGKGLFYSGGGAFQFVSCEFKDCSGGPIVNYFTADISTHPDASQVQRVSKVEKSTFDNCPFGIMISEGDNPDLVEITNNVFIHDDVSANGEYFTTAAGFGASGGNVYNNSVVIRLAGTHDAVVAYSASNNALYITGSGGSDNIDGIVAYEYSNNLVYIPGGTSGDHFKTTSPGSGDGGSNLTGSDPLYTNIQNDLTPQESSPLINAGTTIASVTDDILGESRPQGSSYDIGAYELVLFVWDTTDGTPTYERKFGSGFEIHGTANRLATRTFESGSLNRQAPYFVTIPGPANLRRRTTPYKNET